MEDLLRHAVHGEDGTSHLAGTWFRSREPEFGRHDRWGRTFTAACRRLALLVAAYRHESRAGRADRIEGLDALLQGITSTNTHGRAKTRTAPRRTAADSPSASGRTTLELGSMIWTWLALDGLTGETRRTSSKRQQDRRTLHYRRNKARPRVGSADAASRGRQQNGRRSLWLGRSYFPLLSLAHRAADPPISIWRGNWETNSACFVRPSGKTARRCWAHSRLAPWAGRTSPHGATEYRVGVGQARSKPAATFATYDLATCAFAFEDSLFDEQSRSWLDLRGHPDRKTMAAWCHGAVESSIRVEAHLDLDPDLQHDESTRLLLRRAVDATWRTGAHGMDHGICHGDASA